MQLVFIVVIVVPAHASGAVPVPSLLEFIRVVCRFGAFFLIRGIRLVLEVRLRQQSLILLLLRRCLRGWAYALADALLLRARSLRLPHQLFSIIDGSLPILPIDLVRVGLEVLLVVPREVERLQRWILLQDLAPMAVFLVLWALAIGADRVGSLIIVHEDELGVELIMLKWNPREAKRVLALVYRQVFDELRRVADLGICSLIRGPHVILQGLHQFHRADVRFHFIWGNAVRLLFILLELGFLPRPLASLFLGRLGSLHGLSLFTFLFFVAILVLIDLKLWRIVLNLAGLEGLIGRLIPLPQHGLVLLVVVDDQLLLMQPHLADDADIAGLPIQPRRPPGS